MTREMLVVIGISFILCPTVVEADHHHQHPHHRVNQNQNSTTSYVAYPVFRFTDSPAIHLNYGHRHLYGAGRAYIPMAYFPPPVQMVSFPMDPVPQMVPFAFQTFKVPKAPSTPAARMKSLDLQARGDQKMRDQKWSEARVAYMNSIRLAPDRAEAHLRLAICDVTIQRFDFAIRELKRALDLDPKIAERNDVLAKLFGPDSKLVRAALIGKLGEWVREDEHHSDRLFLYGAFLSFEGDQRAQEVLESALLANTTKDVAPIQMFLGNRENESFAERFWKSNDHAAPLIAQPNFDLRFPKVSAPLADAPVPMP